MPNNTTDLIAAIHALAEAGGDNDNLLGRAIIGLSTQLGAAVEQFAIATSRHTNLEAWAATQGFNITTNYENNNNGD